MSKLEFGLTHLSEDNDALFSTEAPKLSFEFVANDEDDGYEVPSMYVVIETEPDKTKGHEVGIHISACISGYADLKSVAAYFNSTLGAYEKTLLAKHTTQYLP